MARGRLGGSRLQVHRGRPQRTRLEHPGPSRYDSGQVWTQNEGLQHPEIKAQLGLDKPENIVKVREAVLWVMRQECARQARSRA